MPVGFDMCRDSGGKIRTKTLGDGKYMHICYLGKKSYAGEVKTKAKNKMAKGKKVAPKAKKGGKKYK